MHTAAGASENLIPHSRTMKRIRSTILISLAMTILCTPVYGEYGDVVLNNTSKAAGMNPVIFPHWIHRMKFSCRACHETLGFKMKAGTSGITMQKIFQGEYCAVCHNGKVAFDTSQCQMCHSGRKELPTQVHRSTSQTLVSPVGPPAKDK
ncbi:MAG: cytochrome c3 family protein [Gammaproteobacteria bacterium]|jgi:c(7)-type cytochrome triheme protein